MKNDDFEPTNHGYLGPSAEQGAVDAPGGLTFEFTAGGTLVVGDAVHFTGANTVNKTNVPANMQGFAGIVVGGKRTNGRIITRRTDVGVVQAAQVNETVIVQYIGKAIVIADAAVAVNANLTQGAVTAGRVDDSAGATQGQIIGRSLEAAANPGDKFLAYINHR